MDHILGDYQTFYSEQKRRLHAAGIHIGGMPLSHLAFRTATMAEYFVARTQLEAHAIANVENVWNGRPISKILLRTPLEVEQGVHVDLIELIPPVHQAEYRMGLEHVGVVVGTGLEEFGERHRDVLTGRQYQTDDCRPFFIAFDNLTNVKFYKDSLMDACISEGKVFNGFRHCV